MSLFGLHRRLRAAIVGHLALFEMTSSIPNRRYGDGLRRLGFDGDATLFFDEHVEADAVHENVAAVDLAGGLVRQDPALAGGVLWGAEALAELDARWCGHVLGCWRAGRTSLRYAARRRPAEPVADLALGLSVTGCAGALKPICLWVPSQNGRSFDFPQRHSATVRRRRSIASPSGPTSSTGPRTSSGPSRYGVMRTASRRHA